LCWLAPAVDAVAELLHSVERQHILPPAVHVQAAAIVPLTTAAAVLPAVAAAAAAAVLALSSLHPQPLLAGCTLQQQ
jgi:hypothetical protein